MATAFKALDPATFIRKPQPNIRVAFSATPAIAAVREKAAGQGTSNQTLDEIAAAVPPLRLLLAERNAIMERVNTGPELTGAEEESVYDELGRLEKLISDAPARSAEEAVVKLVAAAQVAAEGHELEHEEAIGAIVDAQRFFGVGYIHAPMRPVPRPVAVADPSEWRRLYDAYLLAHAARHLFEKTTLAAAHARYSVVRDRWPLNYTFANDPEAAAAVAEVDYDAEQDHCDGLVRAEHYALVELIMCPAPLTTDLAVKLTLFHAEDMWTAPDAGSMLESLAADARRLSGHGLIPSADHGIAKAFKARRTEAAFWLAKDRGTVTDELEEQSAAIVREAENVLFGSRAMTIEGVIARLRTLFPHINADAYADHAIVDPAHRDFRDGLRMAGGNDQQFWSCIEDLARIGGVDLAEQGR